MWKLRSLKKQKKKNTSLEHMMKFKNNYIQYTYLWVNKTKKKKKCHQHE